MSLLPPKISIFSRMQLKLQKYELNVPIYRACPLYLWSGRRDSNSRQPAWKAGTLPTELLPLLKLNTGCEQFTKELLYEFIKSRASGSSKKTLEIYQLTLGGFIGYPLTPEGINRYLLARLPSLPLLPRRLIQSLS